MTHEQFCRSLVLLNYLPQAIITLGLRVSILATAEERLTLFTAFDGQNQQWHAKKQTLKTEYGNSIKQAEAAEIEAITLKRHGA